MELKILIRNHKSQLAGDRRIVEYLREHPKFRLRVPNAWYAMKNTRGWDGYKRFISEGGLFDTGLLHEVLECLSEKGGVRLTLSDKRRLSEEPGELVTELGGLVGRGYQIEAVKSVIEHTVGGLVFQRGVLHEATNAGKNLIAAMLYASLGEAPKGLFLINNKVIFNQAVVELTELLGSDTVGWCSSEKGVNWKNFNVCMVQTLSNRIKSDRKVKQAVEQCEMLLVDEADEVIGYKNTKHIFSTAWDAPVRVALTGSADTAKNKIKNKEVIAFFGPIIHTTTNKDLVEQGFSARPFIKIHTGNTHVSESTYTREYELGIMKNKKRNKKVWKRVAYHLSKGRHRILILYRYHKHLKYLWKTMPPEISEKYRVVGVHGAHKTRENTLRDFKEGKVDILISSMIIKRGKNLPLMQVLINAAAGDSHTTIKQILGRGMRRKAGIKTKIYMDDFFDTGQFLKRHAKHRVIYYKKEGFPVKELYKKNP